MARAPPRKEPEPGARRPSSACGPQPQSLCEAIPFRTPNMPGPAVRVFRLHDKPQINCTAVPGGRQVHLNETTRTRAVDKTPARANIQAGPHGPPTLNPEETWPENGG